MKNLALSKAFWLHIALVAAFSAAGQSQTSGGNWEPTDIEGTWVRTALGCEGSPISPSKAASRITLRGVPNGSFTMLVGPTESGFDGGVIAYQGSYSTKVQGASSMLEGISTIATFGQGIADETHRGKIYQLTKASAFQVTLVGGQLTFHSSTATCRSVMSFRKALALEISTIDQRIAANNPNLVSVLAPPVGGAVAPSKQFGDCYVFASWLTPQEGFVSKLSEWPDNVSEQTLQRQFWNWFKANYPQKLIVSQSGLPVLDEQIIKTVVCHHGPEFYMRNDVQDSIKNLGAILVNWVPDA